MFFLAQQVADPNQIPGWVYAQGGALLIVALGLLAIIKQMLSSFETRTDRMLETFKTDQSAERQRVDTQQKEERLRSDAQQKEERSRSDTQQAAERTRSDQHLEKVYAKLDQMSDRLYEARCRLPPGGCDLQRLNRIPPPNEAR